MTPQIQTTIAAIAAALIACTTTGCGDPCLPTFTEDTLLIAPVIVDCEADTSTSSTTTGDTSTTTIITGDMSTGGTDTTGSTTADPVTPLDMPPVDPLPVCIAIPGAGEEWGPCLDGKCAEGLSCKVAAMGDVCLAPCDVPGPCNTDKCSGGTCDMDLGACVASCEAAGDPCPLPGMECFFGAPPLCAHNF